MKFWRSGGRIRTSKHPAPKAGVLPIELPRTEGPATRRPPPSSRGDQAVEGLVIRRGSEATGSLPAEMGSLIKKRRKRMRKKKHKKMLKATRWQRRAGK